MLKRLLKPPHVKFKTLISHKIPVHRLRIQSKLAANALKREPGLYITLETGLLSSLTALENACACLAGQLRPLLNPFSGKTLCICGIGNRERVHDSLGPEVARRIRPKLYEAMSVPSSFEKVAVVCPGVDGQTNLSCETVIAGIASKIDAACILTIDACNCSNAERLCSTIQVSDSGMQTYSGTGRLRQSTLGVPVVSIVVPTMMKANAVSRKNFDDSLFLTPTCISDVVEAAAFVIACAITQIVYPELDYEDCKQCIGLFLNGVV
ncbi:GPR endopeptidase [Pseudoflavonifractor sp. 524-17]|uniref:GPR endopeptidase n=1 Tax=Pseudoflavonifractor sp. 524-17 TaxID=2304577 RepID=UPI00137A6A24|nr:GPR endopeptidase [Pseudoflavonifractor sp. 524-17]NCE65094.1 GPR endopeptidase [Pseudoflavonifractor sp. 524-17]